MILSCPDHEIGFQFIMILTDLQSCIARECTVLLL